MTREEMLIIKGTEHIEEFTPSRQDIIREQIAEEVRHHFGSIQHTGILLEELVADHILSYLHSQGCVIKVDRELPKGDNFHVSISEMTDYTRQEMLRAGYVAVESLIDDEC